MKRERRPVSILLGALLVILILTNIVTLAFAFSGTKHQQSSQSSSAQASLPNIPATQTPVSSMAATPQSATVAVPQPAATSEADVINAAVKFLRVYYNLASDKPADEYIAGFSGLVTENGLKNMSDYLVRPASSDPNLRIERSLHTQKSYIHTNNSTNASVLSVAYIRQELHIQEQAPIISHEPILIRLELKLDADNVWRVNYITFERSLSTLPMDMEGLLA